jgi:hypothetical protein
MATKAGKAAGSSPSRKGGASGSAKRSRRKTPATRAVKGLIAKTAEALDPVVAGAVVGAVTGAARAVAHEPTAVTGGEPRALASSPAQVGGPSTKEVLGELASGAAVGAASGAAKSVLPPEKPRRAAAKKSSKK